MIITGSRFTAIGEALFGPTKWFPVLAQMVGHDRTMVWRYATGKAPVPVDMKAKLAALCRAKSQALARIAGELDA